MHSVESSYKLETQDTESHIVFAVIEYQWNKANPLFSVERPYIKEMCVYSLFIVNMQHIAFLLYKNLQMD